MKIDTRKRKEENDERRITSNMEEKGQKESKVKKMDNIETKKLWKKLIRLVSLHYSTI